MRYRYESEEFYYLLGYFYVFVSYFNDCVLTNLDNLACCLFVLFCLIILVVYEVLEKGHTAKLKRPVCQICLEAVLRNELI